MNVFISKEHKCLVVDYNKTLAEIVPAAREIVYNDRHLLVLPDNDSTARAMLTTGVRVAPPVTRYYDWSRLRSKLFDVQIDTVGMLTVHPRMFVLNSMGTGKTRCALLAFDYLKQTGQARKMMVVAPLSVLHRTWLREALEVVPHLKVAVLHGTRKQRIERLNFQDVDIYVINHDGFVIVADEVAQRSDIDVLCIDELAVFRSPSTRRTKAVMRVARHKARVWGMTGSPMPNSPVDVWSQIKIVTPWNMDVGYTMFRERVMRKVSQFKWVPKPEAPEIVSALMQPAVRYTLDDVVELPPVTYMPVEVEMTKKHEDAYNELARNLVLSVKDKDITAANSAVLFNKLLQLSMGWVYSTEKEVVSIDDNKRLDVIAELVEGVENKVIVFVPFLHAMTAIHDHLVRLGHSVESVSGETSLKARNDIFFRFQTKDEPRVLVAHPQCMAHGLTLTAADTVIWAAPIPSLEIFEQANARITRIGQTKKQRVIMLYATKVEKKLYSALRDRQDMQQTLLDLMREMT